MENENVAVEFRISPSMVKMTISIAADALDRVRNAAYWSGHTVSEITQRAIASELLRMESERGAPFERRAAELNRGRPRKPRSVDTDNESTERASADNS